MTLDSVVSERRGRSEGHRYNTVPCHQTTFHHAKPIYEELPGWNEDITHCRTFDELPKNARDYITFIEDLADVPVSMIAVGPEPRADDHAALGAAPVACREGRGRGRGPALRQSSPGALGVLRRAKGRPAGHLPRLRNSRRTPAPARAELAGCGGRWLADSRGRRVHAVAGRAGVGRTRMPRLVTCLHPGPGRSATPCQTPCRY